MSQALSQMAPGAMETIATELVRPNLVVQSSAAHARTWLLAETATAAYSITAIVGAERSTLETQAPAVLSRSEALLTLFFLIQQRAKPAGVFDRSSINLLGSAHSAVLLARLLQAQAPQFPWLAEQCLDARHPSGIRNSELQNLQQLLDTVRLHEREEGLIGKAIDEFGNVDLSQSWTAELLGVLAEYEQLQSECARFDAVGILEKLLSALNALSPQTWLQLDLPQNIVLYRPSQIFSLEAAIFRRVSELTSLRIELTPRVAALVTAADALEAPSTRYLKSLQRFVASLAKVPPRELPVVLPEELVIDREQLVETVIDGVHVAELGASQHPVSGSWVSGIWVWENQDQLLEVRRLVGSIQQAILQGRATPNDYHVLCFGLSDYRANLEQELARANLPFQFSTPQAASSTLSGDYLRSLLHWFRAPSLSSARTLLLHPMLAPQRLSAADIELFLARIQSLLDPSAAEQIQTFARNQLSETTPSPTELLHELTRRGYGDEDSVWDSASFELFLSKALSMLARGLRADEKFRNRPEQFLGAVLGSLIVLEREFRNRQTLAASPTTEQVLRGFSRLFHEKRRKPVPRRTRARDRDRQALSDPHLEAVRRRNTQAIWVLHRQLRKTRREHEALQRTVTAVLPAFAAEGSILAETIELISATTNSLALPASAPLVDTILLSDFSDARPVLRKAVCVLGCTSNALQHQGAEEHPLAPDLASIGQTIRSLAGNAQRFDERAFTFAELLRESCELVLSAPESTVRETVKPAWISLELAAFQDPDAAASARFFPHCVEFPCTDFLGTGFPHTPGSQSAATPVAVFSGETATRIARATAQLLARQSPQLTAYDGNLGPDALPLLKRVLRSQRFFQDAFCYSVSNLSKLAQDPFQFFLKEFLRITPLRSSMTDELAAKTGTLIHSALELFFSEGPPDLQLRLETQFPRECERMLRIASSVFDQDEFDWDGHTYLSAVRSYLLMGLDTANERKRGPLLAALVIQRDLLKTMPCSLEWEFGPKGANPLLLSSEHGTFGITGKIDRIDEILLGNSSAKSIWDYKTGTAAKPTDIVKLRDLQIPLYAAAVRQLLGEIPVSGGQLELKNPNRRDEEYASYNKGVKLEHLAITRKGNSTEHLPNDRGAVEHTIDAACEAAKILHARCALGRFAPGKAHDREPEFAALYPAEGALQKLKWADAYPEEAASNDVDAEDSTAESTGSDVANPVGNPAAAPVATLPPEPISINRFLQAKFPDMSRERPTAEQAAALALDYPVCLRAGAGSGKTFVLRSRVLELIRRGEPIQSIAAITFTQKAADEIRHRIEQGISAVLRANALTGVMLKPEERQRFLTAKWHLHQAQIGTIHSLASRIIALDPILADSGGIEGTLVATEQRAETERAVRAVLSGAGAVNGRASSARSTAIANDLLQLLAIGISHWQVREQVLRLLRSSRQLESLQKVFPPDGGINSALLAETLTRFRMQLAAQLGRKLNRFLDEARADLDAWLPILAGEKVLSAPQEAAHREILGALQNLHASSDPDRWLKSLVALERCVLENYSDGNKRQSKKVPRNYFKELKEKLAAVIGRYRQCLDFSVDREASGWEAVAALCRLGAEARERYTLQKRELRVVDFDDQLVIAHRMICKPPPRSAFARQHQLIAKLRAQFRHFLVDEFQDTDPLQWDLISRLADLPTKAASESPLGEPLGPSKSFFMVGDVQQAIYGFRGGDIRVFQTAAEAVQQAEGKSLSLSGNYRSHPSILEFINTFFASLFALDHQPVDPTQSVPEVFAQRPIQFQHLDARRTDPDDPRCSEAEEPEQQFRVFSLLRPYDSSEHQKGISVEAEGVASFVQSVLAEVHDQASDASRWSALRGYEGGAKIALLTRTGKQQLALADALARLEIPYSLSQSSDFYQLDEIKPLIQAIRLQVYPEDTVSLVAVLRSPLFGLTDAELVTLFVELESNWAQIWQSPAPARSSLRSAISAELVEWRRAARELLPSAFLEMIVARSGLLTAYERANQTEAADNVRRCIERIRLLETEQASGCSGSEVLRWLERQVGDQAESPNSNSESHSVVLMTIHKAKGLEFPMVILPFLDASPQRVYDFAIAELQHEAPPVGNDQYFSIMGIKLEDEEEGGSREKTATLELAQATRDRAEYLESKRVFYVAASRAREYLVLSMRERKADKPPPEPDQTSLAGAWLDSLMQRLDGSDHFITSYNDKDFVVPVLSLAKACG